MTSFSAAFSEESEVDISHVNFPAKLSGETKLVYRSRDVRSRDIKFSARFSGESEVVSRDVRLFSGKRSREIE